MSRATATRSTSAIATMRRPQPSKTLRRSLRASRRSRPRRYARPAVARVSSVVLMHRQILTPADFALLSDLRIQAATKAVEEGGGTAAKRKLASLEVAKKAAAGADEAAMFISENDILGPRKKAKADYEERIASIAKGREGREKFGSLKGKRKKDTPSSSTNREKARNKPIMMIMGSKGVKGKRKQSLRQKQKRLRAHIDKAKKSYH
jgi:protein SDA1